MACTEKFIASLHGHGMRMTPQREIVLAVLHEVAGHETADEIFQRVQARSSAMDLSTVYRTLELLQGMRMLSVMEAADGQRRYALTGSHGDHIHLICRRCGCEIEADADILRALAQEVQARYGFALDMSQRSLGGLCRDCAEEVNRTRPGP